MTSNKISERLLKILNKELSQIELHIPNFTKDNPLDKPTEKEKVNKETPEEPDDYIITLPVSIDGYIPAITLFRSFAEMKSQSVQSILSGAKIKYEYDIIPAIAAHLTENQIIQLSELSQVESIGFDEYVTTNLETARKWFGVDKAVKTLGLTGNEGDPKIFSKRDNVIAIIDTGIDINHVDLGSGKVIGWHDEINSIPTPYDDNGHGTHVSSIAAGLGKAIWDYRGVAFNAALVGVKVLAANGTGLTSQVIAGIQWCVNNRLTYGIRVINMSLGKNSTDPAEIAAVTAAVNSGIVVVCSAGNSGPNLNTIGSPADTPAAITVGCMADVGQGGFFLLPFSSRGPTATGLIKPDLVAPGYNITAAKAGTTNQYITMSGTSMSAPFVSGVVSLMLDANGYLTPAQVKKILIDTAELWGNSDPNNDYGYGRLRAFKALSKVCSMYGSKCCNKLPWPDPPKPNYPCNNTCSPNHNSPYSWDNNSLDSYYQYMCPSYPIHFSIARTITQPNSSDWYEFYITKLGYPAALTLLTTSQGATDDVDLYIYDSNYNIIDYSVSGGRQDYVTFTPTKYGKYLVRVFRFSGNTVSYQLDVSIFGTNFRWWQTD